jgi:hypothetical protein
MNRRAYPGFTILENLERNFPPINQFNAVRIMRIGTALLLNGRKKAIPSSK